MPTAIVVLLLFLLPAPAQVKIDSTKQGVRDILKDAEYALRRFQDLTAQVDLDAWKVPENIRATERETLRLNRAQVEDAKGTISRIEQSQAAVSSIDLLDIDETLATSAGLLDDLGYNTLNFQDQGSPNVSKASEANTLSIELTRASATTDVTQVKLYAILRQQIAAQEHELVKCRTKSR
jgi:hypothetical protein